MISNLKIRRSSLMASWLAMLALLLLCGGCTMSAPEVREELSLEVEVDPEALTKYSKYAMESDEFSIETLLALTDDYFENSVEELKDLYLEFEEQQALYSEGRIKTAPVAPVADHSELINTYSIIVERYPRKPGIEAVLYTLGYALFEGNSYDRAGEVFIKFLSMYPKSDYYPEVAFRLGEIYFDASMYNKAISTYSMILEREDPIYFEKALYKISWCYYKLEEYSSSIDSFADLIDKVNETQGAGTASLKAEAKAQIIGSLAHMSIPEEVMLKISSSATREFAPTSLIGLITLLNNQTRNQDALEVFNIFNTIFHSNKLLPLAQAKTIETYRGMNDTEATLRVMEDMVKDFTPESPWYRSTFSDRESPGAKEVDESVSQALLTLSKHYHSINEKNNDPEMLLKAMEGYKNYLLFYPYTKNEKEVYLLLGEASFSSKEYSDAASRYEKTMQFYNGKQEGEDAAFAALLSLELVSAGASEEEELDTAKSAEQLGRIVGFFLNNFPETKRFDDFTFKASGIYTSMGYYKEARQTISNVMKRLDQHTAHKKIGDIFVIEEKIESAIVSYTAALMERDDTALRTKLAKIYYVSADNHFKQGEKETAKKEFFKAYRLTKTGKIAEDSLIKIGFMHIDEGELVKLRKTVTMLKDSFPYSNGPLTLYVEGGKQMIAKGLILAGAGLFEEAGTVARSVTEAQKLIFKAVETLSEAELYNDALLVLNRAIEGETLTKDGLAEAMYLVGTILIDSGKDGEGKEMLKKLVFKTEKPKGKERTFIARARLALLKDNLDKYNSVKIAPPFKSTMRLKEKLLKELINEYTFILKSKVSDIQAETLYMMGLTFEEFHNALITSEKPEGLTEEELMEYNFLLEEKAFKFEDNSIRSYESAIKAARLNSQGGTLHLAIQRLERLRPVLYKRAFSADATNIQPPLRIAIQSRTDARMAGLEGFRFTRKIYPRTNETKASRKHFKQGLKLIKDNPAQAMKKFRAAVSVQPDNVEAIYNLSLLQYRSGNYAGAMTELRKLTEMNVSSVDVLEMHSRMHIKANKIDEAFAMLDKAMLMKRRHTTLTSLAILHEQSGNKNKAEQLYIVLSTMEPEDPFIAYNYGILLLQNGNFAEAEEKLQKALPLKTKYPQIVSAYAKVMAASGRTTEAINMYKEAIKAEPKNPSPNKDIGIIYEIYLRDFTNALIYYKKYIDLNGRDKKEVELWIGLIKEMTGR